LITRRRVIYVSGYDPQGPQGYYALFGSQLKRACALWHSKFVLGPLVIESADIASWTVTMGGPNWQVFTQYDFVRQEDIINTNCAEPIIRQISRCPFRKSYPDVLVMQPSQDRNGDNDTGPLDYSMQGRIFL
jgi:hypothetical protein